MIFGGRWNNQDKRCPGVYINFVSKNKSKIKTISYLLTDRNGLVLKTADGLYLSITKL